MNILGRHKSEDIVGFHAIIFFFFFANMVNYFIRVNSYIYIYICVCVCVHSVKKVSSQMGPMNFEMISTTHAFSVVLVGVNIR